MKWTENKISSRNLILLILSLAAAFALSLNPMLMPVIAGGSRDAPATKNQMNARFLPLGIGKSVVVDLPADIKDVLVADPKIANAIVRSAQRAYIIGAAVGQTNIVFFDSAGQQIAAYDIAVTRDLNGARGALKKILPQADIQIEGIGESVILSGSASTPVEAQQAQDIALRLVEGRPDKVVNNISVRSRDQIMLKVTVAEMQRDIVKQLGIDVSATLSNGTAIVDFNTSNPFTAFGRPLAGNAITGTFGNSVTATIRAMESAGVVRTLAEPNLTAISGEAATFIAGGEFPIPKGFSCDPVTRACTTQVEYKKFGISLNFTPVVLTEGRNQPPRHDRSFRTLQREFDNTSSGQRSFRAYNPIHQNPSCGNDS